MDILITIIFLILLNIVPALFVVAGIILVKDKRDIGKIPYKQIRILGIIITVLGVVWIIRGFLTGYGLQ